MNKCTKDLLLFHVLALSVVEGGAVLAPQPLVSLGRPRSQREGGARRLGICATSLDQLKPGQGQFAVLQTDPQRRCYPPVGASGCAYRYVRERVYIWV